MLEDSAPTVLLTQGSLQGLLQGMKAELLPVSYTHLDVYKRQVERDPDKIVRRALGPHAPLSFAQERLWFLDRMEQGSAYISYLPLQLSGVPVSYTHLIREIFGIKLSLRVFFDLSTIAELASLLSSDARYADTVKRISSLVLQARSNPGAARLSPVMCASVP